MKALIKTYGPAVISGALLALAFPSWNLFPLAWIALLPLFYQARSTAPRTAFNRFLLAGWVFNSLLLHWLMTNVYWAGGWAFWGYQALCVILAVFWGVTGMAWTWIRIRTPRLSGAACLALLWIVMEYVQAHLFSGFGWGALAYSQGPDLLLLQLAALGGTGLVSGVLVAVNALASAALAESGRRRWANAGAALLVVALAHGAGLLLLGQPNYGEKPFRVGIVQSDFSIEMKYDWEFSEEMVRNAAQRSRLLAEHAPADLFVWPEALVMDEITTPGIQREIQALVKDTGCPLFTGSERFDKQTGGYPNSSYLINARGEIVDYYDKVHLVAFGEYVPFSKYLPFLQKVVPAVGEVQFGEQLKLFDVGPRRFGPLICFEVLFADLSAQLRDLGADFLVVITNLGWFGHSAAVPQEIEQARLRAIENRLPVVHSANTGISGVFDPWGRFQLINAAMSRAGRYFEFGNRFSPSDTIMQRLMGSLPVAQPAPQPVPHGPMLFQWAAVAAVAVLLALATFLPRRGIKPKKATRKRAGGS